jgi:ABC-type uncharacterized transport system auxiliary subunit
MAQAREPLHSVAPQAPVLAADEVNILQDYKWVDPVQWLVKDTFIYGLFNDATSISEYTASNGRIN